MNAFRYDRTEAGGPRRLPPEIVDLPSWSQVQAAIRRMENFCFPIVTLAFDSSEKDGLVFVGGPRRFAITRVDGSWMFERAGGTDREVRLWASDQGYYCRDRNIASSKRTVLAIAKALYDTGDFGAVAEVASRPQPVKTRRSGSADNQPMLWTATRRVERLSLLN